MSDFDIIEFGYNSADETINFGTRALAEGGNLHEASTLATLRSSESEGPNNPYINAVVQGGLVYFSVNRTMRIFKDKQCSDVVFNARFDSIVDTFCVSSNHLVVCLRDGMLHLIDLRNDYDCVFSKLVERDDACDKFFINAFFDHDFVLVTKLGQLYRISSEGEFKTELLCEFNFRAEIASFQYPFMLVNGAKLAIFDFENKSVVDGERCEFKKIFPLTHMFLALDCSGNLFRICAFTLFIFPLHNSTLYKDIELLSDSENKQLVAVTEDQKFIKLLSCPNLGEIYSLKIANEVQLIPLDSLNDEVLYISKIYNDDSVSELRFHCVYETAPQDRLKRILRKRKYEEAEQFAQLFNLDKSIINRAKAEEIVEKSICTSEDIDSLIKILDSLDDEEFKLSSCLNVESSCCNLQDTRKILNYGCLLQVKRQERNLIVKALIESVVLQMARFDIFISAKKEEERTLQAWMMFQDYNLIEEVKSLLRNGKVEEAKIIYSLLDYKTRETLTESHVSDILTILNNTSISTYQSFLPPFISITLSILPSTFSLFVKWTYGKVLYLEKHARADFPNNAIHFTEDIVGLMRLADVDDMSFQRQCVMHEDSLAELGSLLTALKFLKMLKEEYRITIPVAGYLSGPQNVVRLLLNIEMSPEDYDVFLKKFLCKYMMENDMEPNEILLSEITDFIQYDERYWTNIIGSILNCISSISVKLEAVRVILDLAPVPWSSTVRNIATDSLKYSHELTARIRAMIEEEPMQIVLRRPKYKIRERRIGTVEDLQFFVRRIIYCNEPTMVADIFELCKKQEFKHTANMLLIMHFIKAGCLEKALSLLDEINDSEQLFKCVQELSVMIETMVNNEVGLPDKITANYYEMASSVFKRLNERSPDDFTRTGNDETLDLIRSVHDLKKHFEVKTTTYDLRSKKNEIINDVLERARSAFEAGRTIDHVFDVCTKLSACLRLENAEILVRFCEISDDYNVLVTAAARLHEAEPTAKNLSLMAVLLMKTVGLYKVKLEDEDSLGEESRILSEGECAVDDDVFWKGLRLAEALANEALCKASSGEGSACMEVARWAKISFFFKGGESQLKRRLFGDVYQSDAILPGFLTFSTIRNIFNTFCEFAGFISNPINSYLTSYNELILTKDEFVERLSSLPPALEDMSNQGQHFTSYTIVNTLRTCLLQLLKPDDPILQSLSDLLKKIIPKVLSSVLTNRIIDSDLVYNLLLSCDRDDSVSFVTKSMRMYKRDPTKFACLSRLGLRLWNYHKISVGKKEMMNSLITIKWWKKYEARKFRYDMFFRSKAEERFEFLVNSECMNVELAKEYCEDYDLDCVVFYKYLLQRIFLNWKPIYEVETERDCKFLIVKNNEEDILKKCEEVVEAINDNRIVCHIITSTWSSVNTYYYEVFIAMIKILSRVDPQQDKEAELLLLIFLKNYQRVSPPSEVETENWYTNRPDSQSLDALSHFRLSFTSLLFTKQIFSIIRSEINLKTYKLWFSVADILKPHLNIDSICSFVVKEVGASGALTKDGFEGWNLYPRHDDLIEEIDECVKNITDLEIATSAIYHLVMHTPQGADQVNVAKLCYKYAKRYRQLNPGSRNVEKAVIKVEKKYFTFSALHILHVHQLAEEKYMNLLTQPTQLISSLYSDERILKKNKLYLQCPNINKATEELAKLFGLDIKKIRYTLIYNYLGDFSVSDLDASIYGDSNNGEDSVDRIAYVCKADHVEFWQKRLVQLGLGEETEEQRSAVCKVKALKVFAMISDAETILELTGLPYDGFMNHIDKITLVNNLHYLGIGLDIEVLHQYNKKELLNRMVQRCGNTLAIKTMGLICMFYEIYQVKYWEFIINNSIKFSLYEDLRTYVKFLKGVEFRHKTFYINAWQKLIDHSINNLSGSDLDQALIANFRMIQSCPVLYSLNFDNAFRRCMDKGKVEFAAVLLQYFEGERRDEYVKEIRNSSQDLDSSLNNLDQNGLWSISYVRNILARK